MRTLLGLLELMPGECCFGYWGMGEEAIATARFNTGGSGLSKRSLSEEERAELPEASDRNMGVLFEQTEFFQAGNNLIDRMFGVGGFFPAGNH